jgi:hypothetical protein
MTPSELSLRRLARRPAFAMVMVKVVIAIAAVLALAMLASNTLQAKASAGRSSVIQAELLADSGLNRAMYYVYNQNDSTKCPFSLVVGGSYTESNVSLGNSVNGAFDLFIERTSQNRYRVVSTGKSTSSADTPIRKTVTGFLDANYTAHAMSFQGDVTIPSGVTVEGDVYAKGNLVNNGQINGMVYAQSVSGSGSESGFSLIGAVDDLLSPVLNLLFPPNTTNVNHYTTYTYGGKTYLAKNILSPALQNQTLGPTSDNPAGVFNKIGSLDLNGNVKINGTLVVIGGSVRVQGGGNVITAMDNFPAAMIDQDINFKTAGASLEIRGLIWLGGRVTKSSTSVVNANLRVTGALFNPGSGATTFDPVFGTINVKYDRLRSAVKGWNASNPDPPPVSVTVVNWKVE